MESDRLAEGIQVLDKGFVRLVRWMGGDQGVVQAARVSFDKGLKTPAEDSKLVAFLWKNRHTTPFEHSVFTFHVKLPIFVARQWIRHRMSSYNEQSARYSVLTDDFHIPTQWRIQDTVNKQGSLASESLDHTSLSNVVDEFCTHAYATYKKMLAAGVAKEMARNVLPVNIYTQWYWTVNAHSLLHFIGLRSESHAQKEMQAYSNVLAHMLAETMPWTYSAFLSSIDQSRYPGLPKGEVPV